MSTHYEILGLRPGATSVEIKTAFRRLAKLFHPDKNPAGKDHFERIMKAYEVLSDPVLKSTYDYRLNNNLQTQDRVKKNSTNKTWSFDEKEMKRRQYYNEHIKQYTKTNAHFAEEPVRKPYNEYKYILFATPLAVALFLLIMNLATDPPHTYRHSPIILNQDSVSAVSSSGADTPYSGVFGQARFDTVDNRKLLVKNETGNDIIVCIFSASGFWRSCFVENNTSTELDQLSKKPVMVFYSSGTHFSSSSVTPVTGMEGAFASNPHFYKTATPIRLNTVYELTLQDGLNKNFKEISEEEFFLNAITHPSS